MPKEVRWETTVGVPEMMIEQTVGEEPDDRDDHGVFDGVASNESLLLTT